jgi:hypothetical protein
VNALNDYRTVRTNQAGTITSLESHETVSRSSYAAAFPAVRESDESIELVRLSQDSGRESIFPKGSRRQRNTAARLANNRGLDRKSVVSRNSQDPGVVLRKGN